MLERLDRLAEADAATAALLKACVGQEESGMAVCSEQIEDPILRWLADKPDPESSLILVVLGGVNRGELQAVLDHLPDKGRVLLLEYDAERAMALFRAVPLEEHVCAGRLTMVVGEQAEQAEQAFLMLLNVRESPVFRILDSGRASETEYAYYHAVLGSIRRSVRLGSFNVGTLVCRGPLWQFNALKNLPYLIKSPGVRVLEGLFRGKPAIVVGAGPSLDRSLDVLARVADGCVVISTGTALRPLREAGIRPDLVVSVDGSHLTAPQFTTSCDDLYLLCTSMVFPPIVPLFKGVFSGTIEANPLDAWIDSVVGDRATLFAGGTVTAAAIDIAVRMGCEPVVAMGLDLSFSDDGTTHACRTMYDGHKAAPAAMIRVPGNFQHEVFTTEQFHCYIDLIHDYVAAHPETRFINVTHGGARIEGMEAVRPDDLGLPALSPCHAYVKIAHAHEKGRMSSDLTAQVAAQLEGVMEQLEQIRRESFEGAMLCNQLIMLVQNGDKESLLQARDLLSTLEALDDRIADARECNAFLQMSLWPASYAAGVARADHEKRFSEGVLAHRRGRELYQQISGAAKWTSTLVQETRGRLLQEGTGRGEKTVEQKNDVFEPMMMTL